ncbi:MULTISPECIES: GNAT family N-acetyltransferase [Nocardiopsis]|uniref:GNAT family N-acetyltransferase n=1 Tax=Nocardiopsis TaxID=2013 RepID=UPI0008FC3AF5|nr:MULTISPECIES: GNAT family N-acetyltransferase [Nocardiopsis]APC36013.1 GNAT family N-acetyltransferase [Nocardiopsis dassonvillei]
MTETSAEGVAADPRTSAVRMLRVRHDDPRVRGLLDGLLEEYTERYGAEGAADELARYPVTEFAAPHGRLVLAELDGEIVAGGAVRPYKKDRAAMADTAEFKRVWTSGRHRRLGLASRVMTALEEAARDLGYTRVLLFTGPAQPEAVAFYTRIGYRPVDPADIDELPHRTAIPFAHDLV